MLSLQIYTKLIGDKVLPVLAIFLNFTLAMSMFFWKPTLQLSITQNFSFNFQSPSITIQSKGKKDRPRTIRSLKTEKLCYSSLKSLTAILNICTWPCRESSAKPWCWAIHTHSSTVSSEELCPVDVCNAGDFSMPHWWLLRYLWRF